MNAARFTLYGCHDRSRKVAPKLFARAAVASRSTSGRATALHSTFSPSATHAAMKPVTSEWPIGMLITGESRIGSGFISSVYCAASAVASLAAAAHHLLDDWFVVGGREHGV